MYDPVEITSTSTRIVSWLTIDKNVDESHKLDILSEVLYPSTINKSSKGSVEEYELDCLLVEVVQHMRAGGVETEALIVDFCLEHNQSFVQH